MRENKEVSLGKSVMKEATKKRAAVTAAGQIFL